MEIKKGNIAVMPAISQHGSENATTMTKKQFDREKKYQAALAIARSMLEQGVINEEDYLIAEQILRKKFEPIIGSFII